jgi:hypothetical protein
MMASIFSLILLEASEATAQTQYRSKFNYSPFRRAGVTLRRERTVFSSPVLDAAAINTLHNELATPVIQCLNRFQIVVLTADREFFVPDVAVL